MGLTASAARRTSVRITLIDRDVPSYFRSLEHLLRSCARPPFALEQHFVSVSRPSRSVREHQFRPRRIVAKPPTTA
jgi:hypothetical protein